MNSDYGDMLDWGTHSMKRTLLSWAGKCHPIVFAHPERRLLGHHLDQENRSVVVYSKDAYVAMYGKVLAMFSTIRAGMFDPDMKAVLRMKVIAQRLAQEDDNEPPDDPRKSRPARRHQEEPEPEIADSEVGSLSARRHRMMD